MKKSNNINNTIINLNDGNVNENSNEIEVCIENTNANDNCIISTESTTNQNSSKPKGILSYFKILNKPK